MPSHSVSVGSTNTDPAPTTSASQPPQEKPAQEKQPKEKQPRAKRKRGLTTKQVDNKLRNLGLKPEEVNLCLRAGILHGHYSLDGENPLEAVLHTGKCIYCEEGEVVVKMKDCLDQPLYGTDYGDVEVAGAATCPKCASESTQTASRQYITNLCNGKPRLDCGKFHHHCEECPRFGTCIGDVRNAHCHDCKKHYFAGTMGNFKCQICSGKRKEKRFKEMCVRITEKCKRSEEDHQEVLADFERGGFMELFKDLSSGEEEEDGFW
jgi:hypothetical protein